MKTPGGGLSSGFPTCLYRRRRRICFTRATMRAMSQATPMQAPEMLPAMIGVRARSLKVVRNKHKLLVFQKSKGKRCYAPIRKCCCLGRGFCTGLESKRRLVRFVVCRDEVRNHDPFCVGAPGLTYLMDNGHAAVLNPSKVSKSKPPRRVSSEQLSIRSWAEATNNSRGKHGGRWCQLTYQVPRTVVQVGWRLQCPKGERHFAVKSILTFTVLRKYG